MALVAHVLHTPLGDLDEMPIEELLAWADEAAVILKATHGAR